MVKGTVSKVAARGKAWDVYIGDKRYGHGFKAPTFTTGDVIEFEPEEVEWKDKILLNIKLDTVKVLPKSEAPEVKAAAPVDAGKPSQSYWDAKDQRITYMACQKDAIQSVGLLLANDGLSLGSAKAKKIDVFLATVNKVAEELFNRVRDMDYVNIPSVNNINDNNNTEDDED